MLTILLSLGSGLFAQNHPGLILTREGVREVRAAQAAAPLFEAVVAQTRAEVDAEIKAGIAVPIPKDMAGGYTHERHKKNFFILQKAGNLYQLTGEEKYAVFVRDMFLAYADLYPTLGLHPTMKSYATGKIFWQCLNDANWLVYASQAYDCVYDFLTEKERRKLEKDLFRPMADFLSVENPQFFNRIHNHSTWGCAAVGMIGLVMRDTQLVHRALYGLRNDGLDDSMLDNDGGFIKTDGVRRAGFLAQLDLSFSPDGYFTEGPYYLRYAMTPFLLFAKALSNHEPDLKIYAYRDSILKKSIYSLLNLTDAQGRFFPVNDAQKGMSWRAREVVAAVDIAYADFGNDGRLLSVAEKQGRVLLDGTGFRVARDLAKGLARPFVQKPVFFRDGPDGDKGGLSVLRMPTPGGGEWCAVMKYSAHGMGHGHFDKLSYSIYDETGEVVQDYGAARWVNIDQKGGGRYLPENKTFAKQSIAHNTLVVNEMSHYDGKVKDAEAHHPDVYFTDLTGKNYQVAAADEKHAYPQAALHRTVALLKDETLKNPLFVDVFRVASGVENQYDLPVWFQGHLLSANFEYAAATDTLTTLGTKNGYQHIWREATGKPAADNAQITWFNNGKFFSLTSLVSPSDELVFGRTGAHDPEFNLRRDPCFLIRRKGAKSSVFISILEPHGAYNPVAEIPEDPFGHIESVRLIFDSDAYTIFDFRNINGRVWTVFLANQNADKSARHAVRAEGKMYEWTGPFAFRTP
ncbi:MAG: heparinase [Bacteroidetes bacterium]|nr:MAG: heparinase [Bacteroidota bacterium]